MRKKEEQEQQPKELSGILLPTFTYASRSFGLWKGRTLMEELSFSLYYHLSTRNQMMHLVGVPIAHAGLMVAISTIFPSSYTPLVLGVLLSIVIGGMVDVVYVGAGLAVCIVLEALFLYPWLMCLLTCFVLNEQCPRQTAKVFHLFVLSPSLSPSATSCRIPVAEVEGNTHLAAVALWISVMALLLGFAGQVLVERRLPPLRLFEVFVATPCVLLMVALDLLCGYRKEELQSMRRMLPKWKGSERRLFPGALEVTE